MSNALERWNALSEEKAVAEMLAHCGSRAWAAAMARLRPIRDAARLLRAAEAAWQKLSTADRLEAFAAHPRIGEEKVAGQEAREQSGLAGASIRTRAALGEANREYENRFGHVFLVCATGKNAEEMLALCRERLPNDPQTELEISSEEQRKITRLRLKRWLGEKV